MNAMQKFGGAVRNMAGKATTLFNLFLLAVAVAVTTTPMLAMAAAADPGAAITAEVTSAKSTVSGILIILAGIVGLFILWSYLKRAR